MAVNDWEPESVTGVLAIEIFCFSCYEPISGIRALSMRRSVARVEHNEVVGVGARAVFCYMCTLHLAVWWDEAARANLTCHRT